LVWVSFAIAAQCRFFAARQGENQGENQGEIGLKKWAADAPLSSLLISSWFKLNRLAVPAVASRSAIFKE
jgi:hypothetical protein